MAYASRAPTAATAPPRVVTPVPDEDSGFRVLLTNDDGIHARGLACLAAALHADGTYDVRVVAPHTEQSACGHSITLSGNLEARTAADGRNLGLPTTFAVPAASVRGTPADCVKLATTSALLGGSWRPQLVVSGINRGPNFGLCTVVSGTCAAARQASWQGFPSIAASLDCFARDADYEAAAKALLPVIAAVRSAAADGTWPTRVYVNVNLPDARHCPAYVDFLGMEHACGPVRGVRIAPLSEAGVVDEYVQQSDQLPPGGDAAAAWEQWKLVNARSEVAKGGAELKYLAAGYAVVSPVSLRPGDADERRAAAILWRMVPGAATSGVGGSGVSAATLAATLGVAALALAYMRPRL